MIGNKKTRKRKELAVVRVLDLSTNTWDSFHMPDCLSAGHSSLLAAHDQQLIMLGECFLQYCCCSAHPSGSQAAHDAHVQVPVPCCRQGLL